ncbi:MAG: MBL fold metallo-hydrolase [Candidatus Electrothrix sp. AR5]|nr:MBL fold metallo-hydrolase [Candidatus Electrothrix sp. AR5]
MMMKRTRKVKLIRNAIVLIVLSFAGGCAYRIPGDEVIAKGSHFQEGHLRAQFFGTSTLLISDGYTSIMVDGFFSRPSFLDALVYGMIPDEVQVDKTLDRANIEKIDVLLVAHSHYDHVLDSGMVATKTEAQLIGSDSSIKIAREEAGVSEEQLQVIRTEQPIKKGLFEIRFYETCHSPKQQLLAFAEDLFLTLARGSAYKDSDKNYSFLLGHPNGKILIVPSANFTVGDFANVRADIVFLSIGLLGKQSEEFIRDYWNETVINTGAQLVIPIHWDNFSRSLESPIKPSFFPVDNIKRTMEILQRLANEDEDNIISIKFAPLLDPFDVQLEREMLEPKRDL